MRCVAVKGSRALLVAGLWTLALWALVSRLWTLAGEAASRDPQGIYHTSSDVKKKNPAVASGAPFFGGGV
jgi:hypothetical protein